MRKELEGLFNKHLEKILALNLSVSSIQCIPADVRFSVITETDEYRSFMAFVKDSLVPSRLWAEAVVELFGLCITHPGSSVAWANTIRGSGHLSPILVRACDGLFDEDGEELRRVEWAWMLHYVYAMLFETSYPLIKPTPRAYAPVRALLGRRLRFLREWVKEYQDRHKRPFIGTEWEKKKIEDYCPGTLSKTGLVILPR